MAYVRNLIAFGKGVHEKVVVEDHLDVRTAMRKAARLNHKHNSVGRIHPRDAAGKRPAAPADVVFDFVR